MSSVFFRIPATFAARNTSQSHPLLSVQQFFCELIAVGMEALCDAVSDASLGREIS